MAKPNTQYICQACGGVHAKWGGKCEACGEWNTLVEEVTTTVPKGMAKGKGKALELVSLTGPVDANLRRPTGIGELDRVLGGGLVAGGAILIGGDPGIGKSTLLLQVVAKLAGRGESCLYVSGEESTSQVQLRAARLGVKAEGVWIAAATSVRDILSSMEGSDRPTFVVIDSIQTMFVDSLDAAPGTVSQVRASANELIRVAKKRGITLLLVGHVTKEGQIAGPRVLEHMVDTVLYFEGDRGHAFRILRAVKNRFGGTDEIGVFDMGEGGLTEVANPSSLFLTQREESVCGAAVFAGMEGARPLLVEVQALVTPCYYTTPRRAVVGWDGNRLAMMLAVLEARAGLSFAEREVYLNVAGGYRITEPAADLAVAAALVSALTDRPFPADMVIFGEVALSGELRPVSRSEARLREAAKLGFSAACFPESARGSEGGGLRLDKCRHIRDIVSLIEGQQGKTHAHRRMAEV